MAYYIGIDLGTSSVKLTLVDDDGKIKNTATRDLIIKFNRHRLLN